MTRPQSSLIVGMHVEVAGVGDGKDGKGETTSLPIPSILPIVPFAEVP